MNRKKLSFGIRKLLRRQTTAFTLIELLIVMAVLGSMAGILVVKFPAAQKRTRDAQRKSELKQYQTALESYANINNGFYPIQNISVRADTVLCTSAPPAGLGLSAGTCARDPKDGTNVCLGAPGLCRYFYISSATGASAYILWARLEQPSDTTRPYFLVCSTGISGHHTAQPLNSTCPAGLTQ